MRCHHDTARQPESKRRQVLRLVIAVRRRQFDLYYTLTIAISGFSLMDSYDRDTSVLIVDMARYYGGAEARVIEMARSLHDRRRYAVVALAGSPLSRQLADAGLIQAPQSMSRGDPRLLFAIRRLTLRRNSRIVDAHNPQSQFWGMLAAATAGVPGRVCTVHSACRFSERGRIRGPGYEAVLRLSAR